MQKVKVHRYVSGKRPDYAPYDSSETESETDDFIEKRNRRPTRRDDDRGHDSPHRERGSDEEERDDPRLRRLMQRPIDEDLDIEHRQQRRRQIHEPEVLETSEEEPEEEEPTEKIRARHTVECSDDSESEGDLSDSEIERRRLTLRQRVLDKKQEEEILVKEDERKSAEEESSDSSEYEEYTDSEEEETGPRLKPVFVRKRDRITIIEKEKEELKKKQLEIEAKKLADDRKRQTLRMVEEAIRKEQQSNKKEDNEPNLNDICTDDENDEVEYEAWKLRELKRIKRDREEREQIERERVEIERLRNLTEEERRLEMRLNPKQVTNKAAKGKYKFLQKYYHRGAYYLDNEDTIYKRDFSQATLEDHFDKTILPKVMQVKNFGRSGRTKYTHLVDQDTTHFDSPWVSETSQNFKFHNIQAAGMKQNFDKPSTKRKRDH